MLADEKTRAENRMIVDLLRNDISRITEVGTLDVPKLFEIETYPTLHQMVSHVQAKLLPGISIRDILAALFPCGSITGAPKMRAMEILHELEDGPRDAYCGAVGMISHSGAMRFPWRSARSRFSKTVARCSMSAEASSSIRRRKRNMKNASLRRASPWGTDGSTGRGLFPDRDAALRAGNRLRSPAPASRPSAALRPPPRLFSSKERARKTGTGDCRYRCALEGSADTGPRRQNGGDDRSLRPALPDTVWRLRVAATRLDSSDKLLRFKTTRRGIYEAARAEYRPDEADEVLLLNEKDEVCEGTITSVFLEDSEDLLRTPPYHPVCLPVSFAPNSSASARPVSAASGSTT